MKATEQCFPVVEFVLLYKVVLPFESVDEIRKCDIQMEATEQYFPAVLESVDEILKCNHSNESY